MPSSVEELVLTTHLSRVRQIGAKVTALRPDQWFLEYSAGQHDSASRLAAMAPLRELRLLALELSGLSVHTVRRAGRILGLPPAKALVEAYGEAWRALLTRVLDLRKSIDAIRARMDTDRQNAQTWRELAWQEDTISALVTDVMTTLGEFGPAFVAQEALGAVNNSLEAHRQDCLQRRSRRVQPGVPARRRKRLPKLSPIPAGPQNPIVDAQHEEMELAAELFECEQCGGGMTQRIREGGVNKLVCGYCKHERELAAPARRHVGVVDLDVAVSAARDELKELQGCRSFQCNECGAGVMTTTEQMTVRCAYCSSEAFAQDEQFDDAFEPHGMPRFACDADGAVKLLRNWLKTRPDVDAAFERELQVKAVEARYVPFWAFNIIADKSLVIAEGMAVCASAQVLHRLPAELRAIEPLETRNAPPFTREQMAAVACERFTIQPADALRHALFTERAKLEHAYTLARSPALTTELAKLEHANALARPNTGLGLAFVTGANCRYLLLPLYFVVLTWRGHEYHALVDGARAGVGLRYPKSVTRLIRKRWWVGAAAAGLLVLLAGLIAVATWAFDTEQEENEIAAELDRQAELRAEQRRRELEELKLIRLPLNQDDVTWVSEPFDLTLATMTKHGFELEGSFPVRVHCHLRLSVYQRRSVKQVQLLREPTASAAANGIVREWAARHARITAEGSASIPAKEESAMVREIYRAAMPEGMEAADPVARFLLTRAMGSKTFTGEFSHEFTLTSWESGKLLTVRITFAVDPLAVESTVNAFAGGQLANSMSWAMSRARELWTTTDPDAMATEIAKDILAEWKRNDRRAQKNTAAVKAAAVRR
ncbi:MAG: hypothetical protein IT464_01580 [Planctomycetes bacterium]|nr:hypothetical protein [Planctomycetota bacterium]